MYSCTLPSASALDGVGGQRHPRPLYPRERPATHCIGGWVNPRDGLDGCGNSRPPPEFDPRTSQSLASRSTDYAIPAQRYSCTLSLTSALDEGGWSTLCSSCFTPGKETRCAFYGRLGGPRLRKISPPYLNLILAREGLI